MITFRTAARRTAGVVAGSALAVAAIAAVAGPALAATSSFTDARGDMSQGADIRRVWVDNGATKLRINVVHRDLVRSFRSGSSLSVFIDTDRARTGPEFVFVAGTFEGADYALLPADGFRMKGNRQVPLHGGTAQMRVDYVDDIARIRIDRVVLDNPGRVRVEVKTGAELLPAGDGAASTEVDWLGTPRTFTPWVPRG